MPTFFNDKEKKRERRHAADADARGGPTPSEHAPQSGEQETDPPGPELVPGATPALTNEQIEKLLAEKQELTDTLLRRQADFENFRKRVEKERHQERYRGAESVIERILPVLDAVDNALDSPHGDAGSEYRKGFELVRRQLVDVLAKQGLTRIESVGKAFNPNFHHAIEMVETTEYTDGTVIGELQPGYVFHDRVLRPAMVRVASEPAAKAGHLSKREN